MSSSLQRQISRRGWCAWTAGLSSALVGSEVMAETDLATRRPPQQPAVETSILPDGVGRFVLWPKLTFTDENGKAVELYRDVIAARTVVLNFFYTRCEGGCPETFTRMHSVAKATLNRGQHVRFLSITLEPEHDTPEILRPFRQSLVPRGSDWIFLSADGATTDQLRQYLNFYDLNEVPGRSARRHASMVLIGSDVTHRWVTLPVMSSVRQWRSALVRCAS